MANQKSTQELIPSAKRLIQSLRDVGYDFVHAIADIVDNSIEANASLVSVEMKFDGENSWIRIADNGTGMTGTDITEAMRFGTERDYESNELGRFGLGLKTASLSQCCRLTVASRVNPDVRRIEVRQWDLDHVKATNKWEIINVSSDERPEELVKPLNNTVGTVILWESLDRVLGYKNPWGDHAKANFLKLAEDLDQHLGMVFHRFLSGEVKRKKKLKITLNGTNIEPWDPFAREERATIKLPGIQFEITGDNGPGLVSYTPFILPSQERFSSLRAFKRYAGPANWNFQQGFYIYRMDRMIQSGGWCRMRTSDEHTKLARVALDFRPDLDSVFDLNVSKARVNLPPDLRSQLKPHTEELAKQARKAYTPTNIQTTSSSRARETNLQSNPNPRNAYDSAHQPSVAVMRDEENANSSDYDSNTIRKKPISDALEKAAQKAGELPALQKIKRVLKTENPNAAQEIGW